MKKTKSALSENKVSFDESDIISSLDKAISDFADFELPKPKKVKKDKKTTNLSAQDNDNDFLINNVYQEDTLILNPSFQSAQMQSIEIVSPTETDNDLIISNLTNEDAEFSIKPVKTRKKAVVLDEKGVSLAKSKTKNTKNIKGFIKNSAAKKVEKSNNFKKSVRKVKRTSILSKYFKLPLLKGPKLVSPNMDMLADYKRKIGTVFMALFLFAVVSTSSYIAYGYVMSNDNNIVKSVEKLVILPAETPKVYIIQSDRADLFKNPLFKGIQVGDNVLTYTNANKVIIYRSSEDKIVNIVNLQQN